MQGYERCLEIWPHSKTGYYLEREDATPGTTDWEVDEETETEGHEEQSEPDRWEVLPCLLHEDTDEGGGEGEGQNKGKKVNSAKNWVGAEDSLEIERVEIGAGNEDHSVDEADGKRSEVGRFGEEAKWHHRVFGQFPFIEEEENDGDDAKYQ